MRWPALTAEHARLRVGRLGILVRELVGLARRQDGRALAAARGRRQGQGAQQQHQHQPRETPPHLNRSRASWMARRTLSGAVPPKEVRLATDWSTPRTENSPSSM